MKKNYCYLLSLLLLFPMGFYAQSQLKPISDELYATFEKDGIEKAMEHYHHLKNKSPEAYDFSVTQLNILGSRLLREGKKEEALAVLKLNTEAFPAMVFPFYSYGNALEQVGEKSKAIKAYQHGLDNLNKLPDVPEATRKSLEQTGQMSIQVIENLNLSEQPDLTYVANHGGGPAGAWDVNMVLAFKASQQNMSVNYKQNNFYNAPVPAFVHDYFEKDKQPDVVSGFVKGVYRDYVQKGDIADLSGLWEEESWDEAFPASLKDAVSYEGKPYFVPITYQWNPIWYRKDIFKKLDLEVPTTWEDLLSVCEKLHKAGYVPFTVSGRPWTPPTARWFSSLLLRLQGAGFYEEFAKGRTPWTDPRIKEVFLHWKELFDHHAFDTSMANYSWSQAIGDLSSGKAAMWNIGEWLWEFQGIQDQAENIGFFPVPTLRENVEPAEILHLYGAHLLKNAENKPLAKSFLTQLGSAKTQKNNHNTLKWRTPAHKEAYEQLSPLQKEQYDYIANTKHLVPLFEFMMHPDMAQAALNAFCDFWAQPDTLDSVLEGLEEVRKRVYGG